MGTKVSVVMPVYNKDLFLEEAVRSVLDQTMGDFELIIVDDGSTDASLCRARALAAEDDRIQVLSQENKGEAGARNAGMRAATGDYVALLDGDDLIPPDKLRTQSEVLDHNPHVCVVYSDTVMIDEQGTPIGHSNSFFGRVEPQAHVLHQLAVRPFFTVHSALIRRSALEHVGYHQENFGQLVADWELWYRLAELSNFIYQPGPEVLYRMHAGMMTRQASRRSLLEKHARTLGILQERPSFSDLPRRVQSQSHLWRGVLCLRAGLDVEARAAFGRASALHPGRMARGLSLAASMPGGGSSLRAGLQLRDRMTARRAERASTGC